MLRSENSFQLRGYLKNRDNYLELGVLQEHLNCYQKSLNRKLMTEN